MRRRRLTSDPSSRKPSVAVLPFANLSQEPDTDYFSYGLTEDVIRLLARNRWLDVLSRHSAVAFQGANRSARDRCGAGRPLPGAGHRREAWRARAHHGGPGFGRNRPPTVVGDLRFRAGDILNVQQAMAQQIAAVIEPELARLEREAAVRRPPVNLGAWDCYQRGLWHLWGFTSPGLAEGAAMFRRAIELDPGFARAHGALAYVKLQSLFMRDPSERPALLDEALRHGRNGGRARRSGLHEPLRGRSGLCFRHEYDEAVAYPGAGHPDQSELCPGRISHWASLSSSAAGRAMPLALSRALDRTQPARSAPAVVSRHTGGSASRARSNSTSPRGSPGGRRAFRMPITGRSCSPRCSV